PLGEDALAGRQRNVRLLGEVGHDIDVQRLDDFFVEPRVVGLKRLDEQTCRPRLHSAVAVDGDVHAVTVAVAKRLEVLGNSLNVSLALDVLRRLTAIRGARPSLHRIDAGLFADRAVDAGTVAHGAAEQFIDGYAEGLALDVPQRL